MTEPEVSLLFALYHIRNGLTDKNVLVSLDGAHMKTKDQIHFDIATFLKKHKMTKDEENKTQLQGFYRIEGYEQRININFLPGRGDVRIKDKSGKLILAEAKKGKTNKSSAEYTLMREAIGQLMTGTELTDDIIPVVVVPYSTKTSELAKRWVNYPQIKQIGIWFALVCEDGEIEFVKAQKESD